MPPFLFYSDSNQDDLQRSLCDFMPKGILTRLTVRMHAFIVGGQTFARLKGFVLENHGAVAEVVELHGKAEVLKLKAGRIFSVLSILDSNISLPCQSKDCSP